MQNEPVVIGNIVSAVTAMAMIFYPPLNDAIMSAGGTTALTTAIGTIYGIVTYLVRQNVSPVA